MVSVVDDDWAARSRTGFVVREGVPRAGLDLKLERGGVIRGRVTAGAASEPESGQTLLLVEQGPAVPPKTFPNQPVSLNDAFMHVADTDEFGRYAFRVAPGAYELTGPQQPGPDVHSEKHTIADGQEIERNFAMPRVFRPWKTLRGVVRAKDPNGPPIAGAIVIAEPIGERIPPAHGSADDRGRFDLPRLMRKALVYARSPEGDLAGYATVEEDDENAVEIVTQPAATAHGRVVDSRGKPRARVHVHALLLLHLEGINTPAGAGQTVDTDDEGRFTILGLLIGARCKLFASNPDGGNSADQSFDVKDTRPVDIGTIVLDPRAAR